MILNCAHLDFMEKAWYYYFGSLLMFSCISLSFYTLGEQKYEWFYTKEKQMHTVLSQEEASFVYLDFPHVGKSFTAFKQEIALKESYGQYHIVNPYGYMGKYQFGESTLRAVGITDKEEFLNNPLLQEAAFNALLAKNKWVLRKEIKRFQGKIIRGVKITESGILAAAHLGGSSSVKKYLKSNGNHHFKDGFGTSIGSYLKKFGGYDTACIIPNPDSKVEVDVMNNS